MCVDYQPVLRYRKTRTDCIGNYFGFLHYNSSSFQTKLLFVLIMHIQEKLLYCTIVIDIFLTHGVR